jgi:hypothetical protein
MKHRKVLSLGWVDFVADNRCNERGHHIYSDVSKKSGGEFQIEFIKMKFVI